MGIVYILTNDSMPGIIKIGLTESSIEERIKTLDNTSLPLPFRFYFAIESKRCKEIEKLAHNAFADYRVRENREFFEMDPERAVAALRISGAKEIILKNEMIDESGKIIEEKSREIKWHKKRFSFEAIGVPIGAELVFTRNESKRCTVVGDTVVEYENEHYSLSKLADMFLRELGYDWKAVQGPIYFEYNGKTLFELKREREEAESEGEEDSLAIP